MKDLTDWLIAREVSIKFNLERNDNQMMCTEQERETCNVEKMGCAGCYYNKSIEEGEKHGWVYKKKMWQLQILSLYAIGLRKRQYMQSTWVWTSKNHKRSGERAWIEQEYGNYI